VEAAYLAKVERVSEDDATMEPDANYVTATNEIVAPMTKPIRRRGKAHRAFVASQPCLICKVGPCDAHHLKVAQPRSLGRKVSDEFTVPLCRKHHQELHRHGNEANWWANMQVAPMLIARELWEISPIHGAAADPPAAQLASRGQRGTPVGGP
jgi:hypothetical protein